MRAGSLLRHLLRGAALRCPRCGRGRMLLAPWRFFALRDRCAACGADFEQGVGEFTGAMMLAQFLFAGIALYGSFALTFFMDVPRSWTVAWVVGFGLFLPLLAYRHVKGLWIGFLLAAEAWEREALERQERGA